MVKSGRGSRNLRSLVDSLLSLEQTGRWQFPPRRWDLASIQAQQDHRTQGPPPAKWERLRRVPMTVSVAIVRAMVIGTRWLDAPHPAETCDTIDTQRTGCSKDLRQRSSSLTKRNDIFPQGPAWVGTPPQCQHGRQSPQDARSALMKGPERGSREKPWKAAYHVCWDRNCGSYTYIWPQTSTSTRHVRTHLVLYLFIQQIFIEYILYTRQCFKYLGCI